MKNVQVIDGAVNCAFGIFQATGAEFALIFPAALQEIEFAEDLARQAVDALVAVWDRPVRKQDANGIHGTLFYQFEDRREHFPATKRERGRDLGSLSEAQRRLCRQTA